MLSISAKEGGSDLLSIKYYCLFLSRYVTICLTGIFLEEATVELKLRGSCHNSFTYRAASELRMMIKQVLSNYKRLSLGHQLAIHTVGLVHSVYSKISE